MKTKGKMKGNGNKIEGKPKSKGEQREISKNEIIEMKKKREQ
jgi:hypothetical protein